MTTNTVRKQIPVIGKAYNFTKTAMKVYNTVSPVEAVKLASILIVDECAPLQIKYLLKCGALIAQIGLTPDEQ